MGLYLVCSVFSMTHFFFEYLYLEHFAGFIRNAKCESSKRQQMKFWWPVYSSFLSAQGIQLMRPKVVADNSTTTLSTSVRHSEATDLVITRRRNGQASHPDCFPVDYFLLQKDQIVVATFKTWGLWAYKIIFDLFWMDGPWLVPMCSKLQVFMSSCHFCQETTFTTTSTTGTTTSTTSTSNSTTSSTMTTITAAMQQLAIWGHEVVLRRRYRDTEFTQVGHGSE